MDVGAPRGLARRSRLRRVATSWMDRDENLQTLFCDGESPNIQCPENNSGNSTGKKTPGGAGTHTGHTRDTRAHTGTRITRRTSQNRSNEHNMFYPNPTTHPHDHATAATQQPHEQPQARSRPLPAADSEEAAPSKPDPAGHPLPERLSPRACSKAVGEMRRTVRFLIAGTSPRRVSLLRVSRGVVSHSSVTLGRVYTCYTHVRMTLHAMGRWARKRKRPRSGRVRGTCQKSAGTLTVTPRGGTAFNPTSVFVNA